MLPVAVGSSVVAIVLGFIYWAARIGFPAPLLPIMSSIGVALVLINLPVILARLLQRRDGETEWYRSYSFIWLITLSLVAGFGRLVVEAPFNFASTFVILGAIAFVIVLAGWVRQTSFGKAVLLIAASSWFGTWTAGVVWGRIYKSPLFMEMLIANGIVHHDGVTLAALGNMLRTYHSASMGLDGVPYMAYHWGTPWLFAQLSNITSQSVLEFYQLGYPVTMIPLFFGGVLAFAVQMRRGRPSNGFFVPAIFICATMGLIPVTGLDALGVWTSNLTISESYAVAVPFGLMLLATVVEFWRQRGDLVLNDKATLIDFAFLALFLAGGLVALGYIKISFMILGFAAAGFAGLRVGAWRRWPLLLIGVWMAIWIAFTYQRVSLAAHREGIVPLDFLKAFVPQVWWPFFVLTQLFWSLLFIVLRLREENARTIGDLVELIRKRRILDVEIVAAVALLGILPGFVLHIDGGSAFYFSDIQRWLSVGLLLAGAGTLLPQLRTPSFRKLATIGIVFVALPFAVSIVRNSIYWPVKMLKANVELRHSLYPAAERASIVPGLRSLPKLTNSTKLEAGLKAAENYNPVNSLLQLSRMPLDEKRHTAIFVPQSETKYWNILKRPSACAFSGFVVPSLTGISMIDGMPAADCHLSPYYGLSLFEKRTRPQTPEDMTAERLCERAVRLGFNRVIEIGADPEGRIAPRRLFECTHS
ncbi:MAG TPA: hypothetical protein VF042_13745 [Gemmatimonadaceae bacterium]